MLDAEQELLWGKAQRSGPCNLWVPGSSIPRQCVLLYVLWLQWSIYCVIQKKCKGKQLLPKGAFLWSRSQHTGQGVKRVVMVYCCQGFVHTQNQSNYYCTPKDGANQKDMWVCHLPGSDACSAGCRQFVGVSVLIKALGLQFLLVNLTAHCQQAQLALQWIKLAQGAAYKCGISGESFGYSQL